MRIISLSQGIILDEFHVAIKNQTIKHMKSICY